MRFGRSRESMKIAVDEPYESASMTSRSTKVRVHSGLLHAAVTSSASPAGFARPASGNTTRTAPTATRDTSTMRDECAVKKLMVRLLSSCSQLKIQAPSVGFNPFSIRPHSRVHLGRKEKRKAQCKCRLSFEPTDFESGAGT